MSSGAGRSAPCRTPPSTTSPPRANVHIPTAERAARPAALASAGASAVRPCSAASACATASASFVPDPSPTCGGIASTMRRCAPPVSPSASRQCCANVSARSASAPSTESSSPGCASSTTAGRLTDTPSPPKRRAPSPATASMPRCRRAGASTRTVNVTSAGRPARVGGTRSETDERRPAARDPLGPSRAREIACGLLALASSRERLDYVIHRLALARPARLVDEHLLPAQLGADVLGRKHARARHEDRGLEDCVARAIEAEELAPATTADHHRADPGARFAVVDGLHAHLAPRAGVVQDRTLDAGRRTSRRMRVAERRLAEQQDVVGQVDDCDPGGAQVSQRPRPAVGLDDDPPLAPFDAHRSTIDAPVGVGRRHHRLDHRRYRSSQTWALLCQRGHSVNAAMRTLLIDNYDSFTFNLFHLLGEVNGDEPIVVRNDELPWEELVALAVDNIVISPGPGRPERERDVGVSLDVLRRAQVPVLGVCLGHQALAHVAGGAIDHAPTVMHGRLSEIHHDGHGLFAGIPQGFAAVRYHSLAVGAVPATLRVTAWTPEKVVMGLAHRSRPLWGVQFHPESIATEYGGALLRNFRDHTHARSRRSSRPAGRRGAGPRV